MRQLNVLIFCNRLAMEGKMLRTASGVGSRFRQENKVEDILIET